MTRWLMQEQADWKGARHFGQIVLFLVVVFVLVAGALHVGFNRAQRMLGGGTISPAAIEEMESR